MRSNEIALHAKQQAWNEVSAELTKASTITIFGTNRTKRLTQDEKLQCVNNVISRVNPDEKMQREVIDNERREARNSLYRQYKIDSEYLIKNPEAGRSKAVKILASTIPHVMGLSGTLIKNNVTEYFTILNVVKPEKFWRYSSFGRLIISRSI